MTTTRERYAGKRAANYETLPMVDVEILEAPRHCATCGADVAYRPGPGYTGTWAHTDGRAGHYVAPRAACRYCGTESEVTPSNNPWAVGLECARCGGRDLSPIGD